MSTDEVGWLFVQQYYTILYKDPASLYKFYRSDSQAIHGAEGESVKPILGQQGMREFVDQAALRNCKVRVTSVDSVLGIESSIVLQVLGEISNDNEPHSKFAQTFVLAKADKGYYVASDILKVIPADTEETPGVTESTAVKEVKEIKEAKEVQESQEVEEAMAVEVKEAQEVKEAKETKAKEVKEAKAAKEPKAVKEPKTAKEPKAAKETKESKESTAETKSKPTPQTSPKPRENSTIEHKITRDRSWAAAARTFVPLGVATPQPQYIPMPMMPVPMPMGDLRQMHMMSPNLPVQYDFTSPSEQMNRYGPGQYKEHSH